jgi:hypothetical protein
MQIRLALVSAFAFALIACGGSPLVGSWSGSNPLANHPLIKSIDADVTFTATDLTAAITAKTESNEKALTLNASGTYTSTDKQITVTITSVTGTDASNNALVTSSTDTSLCVTLGDAICMPKTQTNDYTLNGNELTTSLKTDSGTVFQLKVTKK